MVSLGKMPDNERKFCQNINIFGIFHNHGVKRKTFLLWLKCDSNCFHFEVIGEEQGLNRNDGTGNVQLRK